MIGAHMQMNEVFAVGDIHGEFEKLKGLLEHWKCDSQQLVFLGDFVDRGSQSKQVIQHVRQLQSNYGAIALGGNHEDLFLEWLDHPEDRWFSKWAQGEYSEQDESEIRWSQSVQYYSGSGDKTIDSFYDEPCSYRFLPSRHANHIKTQFPEDVEFLRNLPNYYEWNHYIFAHAGVDFNKRDWKNTSEGDFRWMNRSIFQHSKNETGKVVVIGHQRTSLLNKDGSHQVWISPCQTKVGIDGSACFGGLLHGVVFSEDSALPHSVYSINDQLLMTKTKIH